VLGVAFLGSLVPLAACAATIDWDSLRGTGQGSDGGSDAAAKESGSGSGGDAAADGGRLTYAQVVEADRPLLYYRLNDALDSTFAQNEVAGAPSANVGGTITFQKPGLISNDPDRAALFDGATGSLRVASGDYNFNANHAFSLEVWMQPNDAAITAGDYVRVFSDETNPGNQPTWDGYFIDMEPSLGISLTFYHGGSACGATDPTLPSGKTHVIGAFDGTHATIYVNGTAYGTSDCALGITQTASLVIGGSTVGGPWFPGILDEIAVYDYALDQAQVTKHYDAGK
jgi:hypothetical protein